MKTSIEEFNSELRSEVIAQAESFGDLTENAFFEYFTNYLLEAEVIDTADRCFYQPPEQNIRIDGYGGDPIDNDSTLNIIVSDYSNSEEIKSINRSDIDLMCKRASNFISNSLTSSFRSELDESTPEFGLADLINIRWEQIQRIKIIFITNKSLNVRKQEFDPFPVNGLNAEFVPWDINRLHSLVESGREKEEIHIDLKEYGGSITALQAFNSNSDFESYLCIMPGITLAKIYKFWGNRLLERNVRVFLQAKGKVNKGIRSSIEKNPSMFFSYNNGITATASKIEKEPTKMGFTITGITDFQIVNGGQTTASIHEALRRGFEENLGDIQVQMKLSVIEDQEQAKEIVPKISEYANSQNKVNNTDFSSNHPFHVFMENFSRRIFAPQQRGTTIQTKWFYERARGQYAQEKSALISSAEKKKFDKINPRNQKVKKDELAIVINSFLSKPDLVSKGAQKSFEAFTKSFSEKWDQQGEENKIFNERFFKNSMCKVLIFRKLEKLVLQQEWYEQGYRRNIVTYAIAKLISILKEKGKSLNYKKIWNEQDINEDLENALIFLSYEAFKHLTESERPAGSPQNVTEYAKSPKCWESFKEISLALDSNLSSILISKKEENKIEKDAVKAQKFDNQLELESYVVKLGGKFWGSVLGFSNQKNILSKSDWHLLSKASNIPKIIPTSKWEYNQLLKLLERAKSNGFEE